MHKMVEMIKSLFGLNGPNVCSFWNWHHHNGALETCKQCTTPRHFPPIFHTISTQGRLIIRFFFGWQGDSNCTRLQLKSFEQFSHYAHIYIDKLSTSRDGVDKNRLCGNYLIIAKMNIRNYVGVFICGNEEDHSLRDNERKTVNINQKLTGSMRFFLVSTIHLFMLTYFIE